MKMGTKFWLAHVAAAKLETISASAYAKRHGISIASLYYWQGKLKKPTEIVESDRASKFVTLRVDKTVVAHPPIRLHVGAAVRHALGDVGASRARMACGAWVC